MTVNYLGLWGKQSSGEPIQVPHVHLDAGVREAKLMEAGGVIPRADVTFTREGRDGDGVFQLRLRQVITDSTVHIPLCAHKHTHKGEKTYFQPLVSSHFHPSILKHSHAHTGSGKVGFSILPNTCG